MKTNILLPLGALIACGGCGGASTISATQPEPPGDNCPGGGTKLTSGIDHDGDGLLSANEIDDTSYQCNQATFVGDLVIRDEADLKQLEGIAFITGSLDIDVPDRMGPIDLSALARVDGDLTFFQYYLDLDAPWLTSIGGHFKVTAQRVLAPYLEKVGGAMDMTTAAAYAQVDLPRLASIGGDLMLTGRGYSPMHGDPIDLPGLTELHGGIRLDGDLLFSADALTRVEFVYASGGQIEDPLVELWALTMHRLTTIDLGLTLYYTDLRSLELPALRSVQSIDIRENSKLCASVVDALAAQTGAPTQNSGNASCKR